jgi:hypothetical protein
MMVMRLLGVCYALLVPQSRLVTESNAQSVFAQLWHLSQPMRLHPIAVHERVWLASGAAGRLGQDRRSAVSSAVL